MVAKPIRHGKRWRIRPFDANGKRLSNVFDSFKEAELWAKKVEIEAQEIQQGRLADKPPDKKYHELCDYWLVHRNSKKRSPKDDISIIRKHLRPAFGALYLKEITVERVDQFRGDPDRAKLADATHYNILKLLIAMLRQAVDLGWLREAPKIRRPSIHVAGDDFDYLHAEEMIQCFLDAAKEDGEDVLAMYSLALFTGLRQGEIAGLMWTDIDFDRRLITVRRSFNKPTKTKRIRRVPILDPLLPILKAWRLMVGSPLVFPNRRGRMFQPSARIFEDRFQRVQAAAKERLAATNPALASTWRRITFHGCRHSFASWWVMRGGDLFRLQRILGHQSIEMVQRYAHLAPDVFREDHKRFDGLVPTTTSPVVPLRARHR